MKSKLLSSLIALIMLLSISHVTYAQAPNLGTAATYALFTGSGAINNLGITSISGDIGTNAGAFNGFPPGIISNGSRHVADLSSAQAAAAVSSAYGSLGGGACAVIGVGLGNNQTLTPGTYCTGAASTLDGNLVLDGGGNPNAIFIIKIGGAFATSTASSVSIINGASFCNVYWQINGALSLGTNASFSGTALVNGAINMAIGASISGRALSTAGAINLNSNSVGNGMPVTPVITANGGALTFCQGGSVTLSGNDNGGTWSTGSTDPTITVTTSGTYSVTNRSACGSRTSNLITVTVNPSPNCLITGANAICAGGSTQLCVPAGSLGYLWSTGATTNCITVNAAGNYSVTITEVGGCQSICSKLMTVNPLPNCSITGANSICAGGSTQLCVAAGFANYLWSTGATTNCITVNAAGNYGVTITDANGCISNCSKLMTVNPLPNCTITGANSICVGSSTQLCVAAGFSNYLWSTGATTNCITVNAAGNYGVTITDANGCVSNCNKLVTVTAQGVCSITGNSVICTGGSTQLCVPAGSLGYLWSTGATTNCITVNAAGNYSVTITEGGGCTSICNKLVTVSAQGVCSITGNSAICTGGSTQLCVPAGSLGYLWSTGATTNCITVNAAGNYSVTITEGVGCTSICNKLVTINPLPNCSITGVNSICAGGSTQLCVAAGFASYLWSTGATTNCITVSAAGNYGVTITDANGCISNCNKLITVNPLPNCSITGANSICVGSSTQLCVAAGFSNYLWSTGATTNCITVNAAGNYGVTITDANGCISNCNKLITVNAQPTCSITGNSVICTGGSTQLCVPAGSLGYLWSTGATTNCITVNAAGNYSVTITEGVGCTSICNKLVTVSAQGVCSITGNSAICTGGSTQLCVPAGSLGYLWSTGATTNCITVNAAGNYSVTITEGVGCTSICNKLVTVNPLPNCSITGANSICAGQSTQLCVAAGFASYLWSTGATTNCITVNAAGNYGVTITDANGCMSNCSKLMTVSSQGACSITGNGTLCTGQSTQLCVPAGSLGYLWSTGATTNCITVNASGNYSVTVTEVGGCQSICNKLVTVSAQPTCSITGNSTICTGSSTQLCVPAGSLGYLWSTGATTNCITVSASGTYSVTITEGVGCTSVCSKLVTVTAQPTCSITGNGIICTGSSTQLCVPAGSLSYLWSNGETGNCTTVNTSGNYSVRITEVGGCQSICNKIVTVNPLPNCSITGDNIICIGSSTQLCVPAGASSYLWSNGQRTNCIDVNAAGNYSVTITAVGGCQSICNRLVTINQPAICSITGNNTICAGNSTQLCVPAGALSYLWSNGQTGNCTTVNAAGNYSVTVTSVDGCQSICNKVITVVQPTPCSISGNISICEGDSTKLCAPDNCGLYLWSTGATTHCIWVKTPGTYSVTITNAGGCTSVCSQTVVRGPSTCLITGDETICTGSSTQLCVPAGASAYLWSTGAITNCITVNETGYYCVTITNARGCTSVCSKTVTQLTALNLTATITGNCSALGSISIAVTGGTAPFTYVWSSGQTTSTIYDLASGIYTVTVTDANGCKGIKSVTIIAGAASFFCNITQTHRVTCVEASDGEAIVTVTGGTPPYKYRWQNGGTLPTGVYLKVGLNSVTVTDATGCTTTCTIILTVPNCLPLVNAGTISGDQNYCNATELTGIFEVNPALGGSGIIEYMWMYSDFTADFSQGGWSTIVGATGKDLPLSLLPNIIRKTNFIRCVRRVGCCDFIEGNTITKNPTVTNTHTGDRYPCLGRANIFTAFDNGSGAYYQWSIEGASITASNNRIVTINFTSVGRKNLTLTIIKNGCVQTHTTQIEVVNCAGNYGEIITFLSSVNNKKVRLDWVTANENTESKYVVEKSNDGFDFTSIGSIVSQNGANNVYTFTDNSPKIGRSFYRIHQLTPINEEIRVSKIEKVILGEEALSILVYPNPIDKTVFVEVVNTDITEGSIEVYNALGLLIKTQYFTKNQVRYELELGELAAGNYIVRVRQNDGQTATAKMTKL